LLFAEEVCDKNTHKITLKNIMQGLLKDTQQITQGIFLEDFKRIEGAASRIADHPTPTLETKLKLVSNLGNEMGAFKGFDKKVHHIAVNIGKAACQQKMALVVSEYHQLVDACQSCHASFKHRVATILNQPHCFLEDNELRASD